MIWVSLPESAPRAPIQASNIPAVLRQASVPDVASQYHAAHRLKPKTLNELIAIPIDQLHLVDIARVNMLCAEGLPGTDRLDIEHACSVLDQWAERVAYETDRHLYRVTDPRYAEHYRHSEAFLRAEFLLQVLQQDLGVKYDLTSADNFDFDDSRVAFIHGMIPAPRQSTKDTPGGTCASMPVLCVAVGRRLGYPLKLVTTNSHIFVRWDGLAAGGHPNHAWRERFNIEGAGEGFNSFPDDYYKTWPVKITDHQVRTNGFLLSLTPHEELAQFMASRGHCGKDNAQPGFAARCFENAHRYDPMRPCYRSWFIQAALECGYTPTTPSLIAWLDGVKKARDRGHHIGFGGLLPSQNYTEDFPELSLVERHRPKPSFSPPQSPNTIHFQNNQPQVPGSNR